MSAVEMRSTLAPAALVISRRSLANCALWLLVFTSSIVKIEPSPYEAMFVVTLLAFFHVGLRFHRAFAPMIAALVLFDLGGLIAVAPYLDWRPGVMFVAITIYMTLATIFFACVLLEDTGRRLELIKHGYVWTAAFASALGVVGYFADGTLHDLFTRFDRATGTFKDPNVLGPFLVAPIVWLVDDVLTGAWRRRGLPRDSAATLLPLGLMLAALFLSFSRGAWGVAAGALMLAFALRFVVGASPARRQKLIALAVVGLVALVALLGVALSIPAVREVFEVRASLNQDYDLGELGRFGAQIRSIPWLLESPNGFGPLRFHIVMGNEDPHNVYINAFASYGWLGGLAYCALIAMTVYVGWRLVLTPGPFRSAAIPVWSALFLHILQGFQIDTDHWRHLYLLIGLVWGLAAATQVHTARARHLRATV